MARWIERKPDWLRSFSKDDEALEKYENKNDYGVIFIPLRCPRCGSKKVKCYGSRLPLRYHICKACGHHFKSIEKNYEK